MTAGKLTDQEKRDRKLRQENRRAEAERVAALMCRHDSGLTDPKTSQPIKCQRIAGHTGPHRTLDPDTFATRDEWTRRAGSPP